MKQLIPRCQSPKLVNEVGSVILSGSLPPSPADSGVSDVDSSSSGHASTDELKARLQPSALGPQSPLGYHPHQQQFLTPYHYPPGHGQNHRTHLGHQHHYPVRPQCKLRSFLLEPLIKSANPTSDTKPNTFYKK